MQSIIGYKKAGDCSDTVRRRKCGCKILDKFNITQPTLSHHMKILVDCGLVNDRKEGKWHHYSLNKKVIREASSFIEALGK